jgi:cysteine desulfurase
MLAVPDLQYLNEPILDARLQGVYLDHQATDRPRPQAREAVARFMGEHFGNANASANERGRTARRFLEQFRHETGALLGARGEALIFTSGATEGNNFVISSEGRKRGAHLVVSAIEHKCVLESAARAQHLGAKVSIAPVDGKGLVDVNAIRQFLSEGATLVSVMAANNEIGTIQPIQEISEICRSAGARFHTDAAQAVGKFEIDFSHMGIDYLTFAAHKFGGPQGIGGLLCSPKAFDNLEPLLVGGGQEKGMRSGTTPLALCAGVAAASMALQENMGQETVRMRRLRDRLVDSLRAMGPFFQNSSQANGLCNCINGGFDGIPALALMRRTPDVHFSVGSACTSGAGSSHVLRALNLPRLKMDFSFRLSVGWSTTDEDIDMAVASFRGAISAFRGPIK